MRKLSSAVSLRRVLGKLVVAVQLLLFLVSAPVFASALIPQVGWTLISVDSEETSSLDGAATNAFDGDVGTFWHTQWQGSSPRPPHRIDIDLGAVHDLDGFRYLPRQDGGVDGRVEIYVFYVSMDNVTWGSPAAAGTFRNNAQEQEVSFALTQGRYIRFEALTEENGQPWTSLAELNVLGAVSSGVNIEPISVIDTPRDGATVEVGGTLDFSGSGSDPDSNALLSYRWTFGDPTVADLTVEDPRNVMFNTPGTHTVTLTVADHLGLADSTPATIQVTVNGPSATTPGAPITSPGAPISVTTPLYYEDFSNTGYSIPHTLNRSQVQNKFGWSYLTQADGGNVHLVNDPFPPSQGGRGTVLKIDFKEGNYAIKKKAPGYEPGATGMQAGIWRTSGIDELFYAYDIAFPDDFIFNFSMYNMAAHGGGFFASNSPSDYGKVIYGGPMFWGGNSKSNALAAKYGCGRNQTNVDGNITLYQYHSLDYQVNGWSGVPYKKGVWNRIEVQLKVNTPHTASNGIARMWLNGQLIYERTDRKWRNGVKPTLQWQEVMLVFYEGGNSPCWMAPRNQSLYLDNLIISENPITH